jgi:hypothetical protein
MMGKALAQGALGLSLLLAVIGGCGSEPKGERVGETRQAVGETSNLTFRITSVTNGLSALSQDITMRLQTSWDTSFEQDNIPFFACGNSDAGDFFCDATLQSIIPDDFIDRPLQLGAHPEAYSRSKLVNLSDGVARVIATIHAEPCAAFGAYWGPCDSTRLVIDVNLESGLNQLDFPSSTGVVEDLGNNCIRMQQFWFLCWTVDVPCKKEVENTVDDDCDGLIDECDPGTTLGCSVTVSDCGSVSGTRQCNAGVMGPCIADSADVTVEIANGLDDDCDGCVDECNPGQTSMECTTTGAPCPDEPGTATCTSTPFPFCPTGTTPGPCVNNRVDQEDEALDGADNDCDGFIDECNPGQTEQVCAVPYAGCMDPQPGEAACSGPTLGMCIPFGIDDHTTCQLPGCAAFPDGDIDGNGDSDDDDDGLPDCWEAAGEVNLGTNGLTLPLPNANRLRKNIYVEIDYMEGHRPQQRALDAVIDAFARAPIENPDGSTGITLDILVDEELPHVMNIFPGLCIPAGTCGGVDAEAMLIKLLHFGVPGEDELVHFAREQVYRYSIFAHDLTDNAGTSGVGELGGDDFIVSLGSTWLTHTGSPIFCPAGICWVEQAGTFMHELGHTLGLDHGGANAINYKPHYLSNMNYLYQIQNSWVANNLLAYSSGRLPVLNEHALFEEQGLGPNALSVTGLLGFGFPVTAIRPTGPINWNLNVDPANGAPLIEPHSIAVNLNRGDGALESLSDHDDWSAIRLDISHEENTVAGVQVAVVTETLTGAEVYGGDQDGDGLSDVIDNCLLLVNPGQADANGDGVGDGCEILPSAECIDPSGSGYRAAFGYLNAKRGGVWIPAGPHNRFTTGPVDQGQVRAFSLGRWRHAFEVEFSGSSLSWQLGGLEAKASSSAGLPSCTADPDGDGIPTVDDNCPFVSNPVQSDLDGNGTGDLCAADDVLGFDDPAKWSVLQGSPTLELGSRHTQGVAALLVRGEHFVRLTSVPMSTEQIRARFPAPNASQMLYDLYVPAPPPNVHWIGNTQLLVSCPSAGIQQSFIGQQRLTELTTGAWNTISFSIPTKVLQALNGDHDDFSIEIVVNSPAPLQEFSLDNFRFGN